MQHINSKFHILILKVCKLFGFIENKYKFNFYDYICIDKSKSTILCIMLILQY